MTIPIEVPNLGESITQAVILQWFRNDGDEVRVDEPVCLLETDKANTDLNAKAAGVLKRLKKEGDTVAVGEKIGSIEEGAAGAASKPVAQAAQPAAPVSSAGKGKINPAVDLGPAARRVVTESQLDPASIAGTGPGGRITKEDAVAAASAANSAGKSKPASSVSFSPAPSAAAPAAKPAPAPAQKESIAYGADGIARQPMSKLRKRIAERLVQAQHTAAILTTFNEVDLTEVIALCAKFKEQFEKTHGVGLGFMSFFARATIAALRELPRVNAFLEGEDIVYHQYVNLGIAVSTDRGLAVPVLRNAQDMSFARIESEIKRLANATRDGKLNLEELSGGTFSITNGGVFGSLLSTPILNPPQSGILGMHSIQKRPVVINDKVEVRSMMYIVLSYDHRIVDGKEAITFLVRLKQMLEDPARLLLDL